MSEACGLYLRLKGVGKEKVFLITANRNIGYVTKLLGDRPISSYSSNEASQFRDWCIDKGMGIKTVKRVFASVRAIIMRRPAIAGWGQLFRDMFIMEPAEVMIAISRRDIII